MSPFAKYGIEHLSPSACNLFIGSPALFVLQKCMKKNQRVGAAAHRGTAVERGIALGLEEDADTASCIKVAVDEFNRLTSFIGDQRKEKESAAIADFVTTGLKELRPYGKPTSSQGEDPLPRRGTGRSPDRLLRLRVGRQGHSRRSENHSRPALEDQHESRPAGCPLYRGAWRQS